jgi:hypothetical protein
MLLCLTWKEMGSVELEIRNCYVQQTAGTQTRLEITNIAKEYIDTSAYLSSGRFASRRDLLGGEGTTTASSMGLRLFGFCSAPKQNKTKGQSDKRNESALQQMETNGGGRQQQRAWYHHGRRGLGSLLDDGGEVAQVERLHLALVLLHIPLPRHLVRRHPLRLRGRRHHLPRPPTAPPNLFSEVCGVRCAGAYAERRERGGLEGGRREVGEGLMGAPRVGVAVWCLCRRKSTVGGGVGNGKF